MKTVRILGIIVIVALIVNFIKDGISGFIDGWNDAEADSQLVLPADFNSVSLSVEGYKEGMSDSLVHAMGFVIFPVTLLVFYGIYCLIRLLIAVSRGEILIRKNIRRLRFFIYPIMAFSALFELQGYILYRAAMNELVSSDYVFDEFHLKYSWTFMLVIALLTEIFAQAVRIKEENDLTI